MAEEGAPVHHTFWIAAFVLTFIAGWLVRHYQDQLILLRYLPAAASWGNAKVLVVALAAAGGGITGNLLAGLVQVDGWGRAVRRHPIQFFMYILLTIGAAIFAGSAAVSWKVQSIVAVWLALFPCSSDALLFLTTRSSKQGLVLDVFADGNRPRSQRHGGRGRTWSPGPRQSAQRVVLWPLEGGRRSRAGFGVTGRPARSGMRATRAPTGSRRARSVRTGHTGRVRCRATPGSVPARAVYLCSPGEDGARSAG